MIFGAPLISIDELGPETSFKIRGSSKITRRAKREFFEISVRDAGVAQSTSLNRAPFSTLRVHVAQSTSSIVASSVAMVTFPSSHFRPACKRRLQKYAKNARPLNPITHMRNEVPAEVKKRES